MSFYDSPLILDYTDLEPQANYTLDVVFIASLQDWHAGPGISTTKTKAQPVQLLANGVVLKDYFMPPAPMQKLAIQVPASATATGKLRIECHQHKGLGGTGRTCNIAEVWLRRSDRAQHFVCVSAAYLRRRLVLCALLSGGR